ncbi:mannose-1-phosphate guanylyltransferase [Brachybacterium aquaticum]|uniref:Mannose-1-phosphate guanylyltransferase n=1 Tax=Brachybacterium aquaticum TaxID=1432564 RepID=A0A841AA93_9MICO|nr:mannose-1-phosphate guanylyltransferase [Brachybacterium aquaticum]MBB5830873.1 mannose-1-phosphate guanylyltransferase [Brachybacterium aquaticum]
MPKDPFVPVVPAGGSGTRLWPLSRRARPKFLLDLTGEGASLLQRTLARLAPLADRAPIVVTGRAHTDEVRAQLGAGDGAADGDASSAADGGALPVRVLAEPSARNSMPAIALAAALVEKEEPRAVIGSFAADHLIEDQEGFARAVAAARDAAELGYLVTLGIEPTSPSTGFGYIEAAGEEAVGEEAAEEGTAEQRAAQALRDVGARPVVRFVEKPDLETAERFVAAGLRWNAGMFVVRASVLLDELAAQIPGLAAGAREIAAAHGTPAEQETLERVWPQLTAIAIDHALAEPLAAQGKVAMVPAAFDWDDVGDFAALARQLRARDAREGAASKAAADGPDEPSGGGGADGSDVRVVGSATIDALSSRATVYGATHRYIALVGLEGISIVDTEDALLVLADDRAQELQTLVGRLDEKGLGRLR